jgi:hypothetical protein
VARDLFLAIGTMLFAWNMWGHPRFGRVYAVTGIGVAAALLVVNLAVFPEPPGEAGSIELGPLVGLWYLIITIRLTMSLRWVADRVSREER